jgi:PAS domain S-box-containing protein
MVMERIGKMAGIALAAMFVLAAVSGCGQNASSRVVITESAGAVNPFPSFRDVPGVTLGEIAAIEALQQAVSQRERPFFSFAGNASTDIFPKEGGESGEVAVGGFVSLFCDYLSDLFGISFRPEILTWNVLLAGLNGYTVDFICSMTPTEERRKIYYMTDPVSEYQLRMMRMRGSYSLQRISQERLPRYAFLWDSNNTTLAVAAMMPGSFESVMINNINEAYEALKTGKADVYVSSSTTVNYFPATDVYTESFFPLIFTPVSLTTANPDLAPIISVMDKALRGGAIHYVNHLNKLGFEDYKKEKFLSQLTDEEKTYLRNSSTVPMVSRYYNYPMAFYNTHERQWEGITFDVLAEVSKFTGLTFQVVNKENEEINTLVGRLDDGRAHLISDIPYSESLADKALWSHNNFMSNQYALLSKTDFPNISLNEIATARVGLIAFTMPAEMFRAWFPGASNTTEYATDSGAFRALDNGEIDLLMATKNRLLSIINYYEMPNYKANYLFNSYESGFAFNEDQDILRSIIDKALPLIDTNTIVEQWMTKTYDYRAKVVAGRVPWLIGASVLSLIILAMILIQFIRGMGARKRLAALVGEKTAFLTGILDATPDLIFCLDMESRYTECNKSFEDYFKTQKSALVGKDNIDGLNWNPDKSKEHTTRDKKVFTEGKVLSAEEQIPSADGRVQIFETIKTPLILNGKITGLVGMARDITIRKAAEEMAKRATSEAMKAFADAETASEAKSRFIANMSHEMRTPMNVIVGLTDLMLEEDNVPVEAKETLKKINTAGTTLMGLINDVLDISKIEAGKQDLKPVQYDVASFLNDIITLNMVRIGEKPIEFKLEIVDGMPKTLFGDDLRVKQVLNNLLSNAFKYTESGTVTLSVATGSAGSQTSNGNVWVTFTIRDTGIGIRKEDIAKLFSDYNQVDTRANRKIEGTGLGLSITKKFVEMMGGEITVESEYGKGTTFRARIRQGFVDDTILARETVENLCSFRYSDNKKQAQGKIKRTELGYARVLVVDDFPTNLDVAAGMLRKYKMQVDCVMSGKDAVDRIAAGEPEYNAIFMDHMMPGMDGVEAAKLIRAMGKEYAQKIPIIALTANAVAGSEQMFLDNGFNAFLAKPFNVMNLDAIIQRWVRDKSKE